MELPWTKDAIEGVSDLFDRSIQASSCQPTDILNVQPPTTNDGPRDKTPPPLTDADFDSGFADVARACHSKSVHRPEVNECSYRTTVLRSDLGRNVDLQPASGAVAEDVRSYNKD